MKTINILNGPENASAIIQGCMRMPSLSKEEAAKVIRTAYDRGINFFDHATCYGAGEAETRFSEAFPLTGLKREDIYIQSKCGLCFDRNEFDWTKETILTSVDEILGRLKVDYLDTLYFSEGVIETAMRAIRRHSVFVTDTNMAKAGINKAALARHGCTCECFMAETEIAEIARQNGTTRAAASVDHAAQLHQPVIYAVGNAPTALIRLTEHIRQGTFRPELVIGVPVGFVNVVQAKEMLIESGIPCIAARGRKGGSNVAAAICNALLYMADSKNSPHCREKLSGM